MNRRHFPFVFRKFFLGMTLLGVLPGAVHAEAPAGLETCRIPWVRSIEQASVIDGKLVGS